MGRNTHIVFGDNHDIYNPIKLTSALLVSSALLLGCGSEAPSQPKGDLSATASASDISRRIEKLASDEFEGRPVQGNKQLQPQFHLPVLPRNSQAPLFLGFAEKAK